MAPIRWHSGEKPLSMKSSVLCLSRSGLVMLMGMAILQGEGKWGVSWLVAELAPRAVLALEASASQTGMRALPNGLSFVLNLGVGGADIWAGVQSLVWFPRTWCRLRAQQVRG